MKLGLNEDYFSRLGLHEDQSSIEDLASIGCSLRAWMDCSLTLIAFLFQHELFDKFLMYSEGREPPFQAQDTLRAWQEKVDEIIHSMNMAIGLNLMEMPYFLLLEPPLAGVE